MDKQGTKYCIGTIHICRNIYCYLNRRFILLHQCRCAAVLASVAGAVQTTTQRLYAKNVQRWNCNIGYVVGYLLLSATTVDYRNYSMVFGSGCEDVSVIACSGSCYYSSFVGRNLDCCTARAQCSFDTGEHRPYTR